MIFCCQAPDSNTSWSFRNFEDVLGIHVEQFVGNMEFATVTQEFFHPQGFKMKFLH